jgi:hypothetical protein
VHREAFAESKLGEGFAERKRAFAERNLALGEGPEFGSDFLYIQNDLERLWELLLECFWLGF